MIRQSLKITSAVIATTAALLANTNLGGENAHRGAVLGGIVSLACGSTVHDWFERLVDHEAIQSEIAALLSPFLHDQNYSLRPGPTADDHLPSRTTCHP
jgi:hypothetical protein